MSTLGQPNLEPAWKQEVNRRLAEHRNRRGAGPAPQAPEQPHPMGSSRAAKAAARVAVRYSKAPSYSQMQAEEARMAVRAAEIATQVALEAQAAAEDALAELHAASQAQRSFAVVEDIARARADAAVPLDSEETGKPAPEPALAAVDAPHAVAFVETPSAGKLTAPAPAPPAPVQSAPAPAQSRPVAIRWEPDIPARMLDRRPVPQEDFQLSAEDWWMPAQETAARSEPITVEPEPAQANLIQFPRELVATRRLRPRLTEAPAAARPGGEGQLSIFEVDPGAVPADLAAPAAPHTASTGPEWSGIHLDAHPLAEAAPEPGPEAGTPRVDLAPLGRRLLASVVDGSLVLAAFFASVVFIASRGTHLPGGKPAEALAAGGLALAGLLYHALFFAFGLSTPGMRYSGIALSTFDDEIPAPAQMRRRLGAMALSLAPVGLGFAWSIFDEDHLSWHDRISQTYLRRR